VDSDLATLVRTLIVVALIAGFVFAAGKWTNPLLLPGKTLAFLFLSAAATGASWLCYFRALKLGTVAQVAPVDKFSLVLTVIFAAVFLGESISWGVAAGVSLIVAGTIIVAVS